MFAVSPLPSATGLLARLPNYWTSAHDSVFRRIGDIASGQPFRHDAWEDRGALQVDYAKLASDWQDGDRAAGNELFAALGDELRAIAAARLRQERHCSLSIGDLVNEAIIKLFRLNIMELQSRAHILALTSRLMRQILIDEARKRASAKHQHASVTLTANVAQWQMPLELMAIEMALRELSEIDPERAEIVEMRFFGGMSSADIAVVLGISEATVKRRWASTRAWLYHRLDRP